MTKPRLTDRLLYTLGGLTLLSVVAAFLVSLHSFGTGLERHDIAVVLLGLPGCAVLPLIPDILLARYSSLFDLVVLPWMINCALALTLYFAVRPFAVEERSAKKSPAGPTAELKAPHKPTL